MASLLLARFPHTIWERRHSGPPCTHVRVLTSSHDLPAAALVQGLLLSCAALQRPLTGVPASPPAPLQPAPRTAGRGSPLGWERSTPPLGAGRAWFPVPPGASAKSSERPELVQHNLTSSLLSDAVFYCSAVPLPHSRGPCPRAPPEEAGHTPSSAPLCGLPHCPVLPPHTPQAHRLPVSPWRSAVSEASSEHPAQSSRSFSSLAPRTSTNHAPSFLR